MANRYSRIFHHISINDVKKNREIVIERKRVQENKEMEEKNYIDERMKNKKSNWRESFTNVTVGMKVGQTFVHNPSGQTVTTAGALGGVETISSTVSISGDQLPGPDASQYGLQGYAKPMNIMRRKDPEDTNKKLDASQEFAKKVGADVMMNARVKSSNIISQTNTARKVFIDYLTGKMKAGRWNEYLGKNYINNALKNATLNPDGSVTIDDNVIGGARNIEYDEVSGTYKINFMGLGFQTNESEFAKNPADYSEFWKSVFNKLGKYSADAQPQFHVPTKVLQGWAKLLNIGFGAIFGKVIEYYKAKGTAIDVNAFIEFSPEEIYELNPQLANDIEQRNLESDGFDTGHGYSSPPAWLDKWARKVEFTGDLRSLWDGKTRTWNLRGKIVDNYGRSIKKPITPKPSKSKSAEKIKSMAKTKRQSLSLDEPIVRRKNKKN